MKKMMVKKHALWAAVFCAALLFSGCRSIARQLSARKITYDESVPPEKSALVVFSDIIRVRSYNGIDVGKAWYPKGKNRINKVTLPAGDTSIQFDLNASVEVGNIIYYINQKDLELRFDFEAGKEYTVAFYTKGANIISVAFGKSEFGVAVWDYASSTARPSGFHDDNILKSWKLGEF